jgi:hypothetical protein
MLNRCFLSWRDEDDDDVTGENRAEKHDFQSRVTDDSDGPEIRGMLGEGGRTSASSACLPLGGYPGLGVPREADMQTGAPSRTRGATGCPIW